MGGGEWLVLGNRERERENDNNNSNSNYDDENSRLSESLTPPSASSVVMSNSKLREFIRSSVCDGGRDGCMH